MKKNAESVYLLRFWEYLKSDISEANRPSGH